MAILNIMAWPDMAIKMAKRYISYEFMVNKDHLWRKKYQNIYLMKVMAKIDFTPDIGYH